MCVYVLCLLGFMSHGSSAFYFFVSYVFDVITGVFFIFSINLEVLAHCGLQEASDGSY